MKNKQKEGEPKSAVATALKWVGGITALLSFVFALLRVTDMISENRERHRSVEEFYRTGKLQQSSLDYAAAWKSFESGLSAAGTGNSLAKVTGKGDEVAFYCHGKYCSYAAYASAKAIAWGYTHIYYFAGGFLEWDDEGYPIAVKVTDSIAPLRN